MEELKETEEVLSEELLSQLTPEERNFIESWHTMYHKSDIIERLKEIGIEAKDSYFSEGEKI